MKFCKQLSIPESNYEVKFLTVCSDGDPLTRSFAMAGLNVWGAVFAATVYAALTIPCSLSTVLTMIKLVHLQFSKQ